MAKLNEYLTVGEASEYLGVSRDTLRRWDRAGKLEARRHPVTGYRLYLTKELDHFLRQLSDGNQRSRRSRSNKKATKGG